LYTNCSKNLEEIVAQNKLKLIRKSYFTKCVPQGLETLLAVPVDGSGVENGGDLIELIPRAEAAVALYSGL
jgi:hypothetical protein